MKSKNYTYFKCACEPCKKKTVQKEFAVSNSLVKIAGESVEWFKPGHDNRLTKRSKSVTFRTIEPEVKTVKATTI